MKITLIISSIIYLVSLIFCVIIAIQVERKRKIDSVHKLKDSVYISLTPILNTYVMYAIIKELLSKEITIKHPIEKLMMITCSIIISFAVGLSIYVCRQKEKDLSKFDSVPNSAVPVQIYLDGELDTIINYSIVVVNDSMVVFDSLGIKITGYNKN